MNELFVNVKVDREERPDVDAVYMQAVQALTGSGGWPMTVFLHARRPPVLRRHVLPERGPPRACRRSRRVLRAWSRGVAHRARRRRGAGRPACARSIARDRARGRRPTGTSRDPGDPRPARRERAARSSTPRGAGSGARRSSRQAMTIDFLLPRPACATGTPSTLEMITDHARRDGRGRHPRPARRRVPPLLDRRAVARPALREDALRQRAARRARTCTGWLATGERALPAGRRGASSATCCATCATRAAASSPPRTPTPRASRASSTCGRSRSSRGVRRRRRRGRPLLRRDAERQLRRPAHRLPRQHPPRRRPHRAAPGRGRAGDPPALLERRGPPGSARASTTRCCSAGTRSFLRALDRGRGRVRPRRLDGRGARAPPGSCSASCAGADGRLLPLAGRPGPRPRVRRGLRRAARSAAHARRARRPGVARRGARASPTSSCACSATPTAAGSSPPAPTPRRSSCGRRTSTTTRRRRRTRSPPRPAAARRAHRRRPLRRVRPAAGCGSSAPVLGEHPDRLPVPARRARAVAAPADRDRGGRRRARTRRRCGGWCCGRLLPNSVTLSARPGDAADVSPLLADRPPGRRHGRPRTSASTTRAGRRSRHRPRCGRPARRGGGRDRAEVRRSGGRAAPASSSAIAQP